MKSFYLFIVTVFSITGAGAATDIENFIALAKKASSVYSGTAQVDINNSEKMAFETLLNNQKIYLSISASKLNSSVYTLINSEANLLKKKVVRVLPPPPILEIGNLVLSIDTGNVCSSTGNIPAGADTSCTGKDCSITQLVISKCNEDNCWATNSGSDRTFSEGINGSFNMTSNVDISKCLTNNNEGIKHVLNLNESTPGKGGTIQYQITVVNDVVE